jgi:hypothetical protein
MVKLFRWDPIKNEILRFERQISFEDIEAAIEQGNLLDIITHPNKARYPTQKMLIVRVLNYVYMIPFVEDRNSYFLKTIIPTRKLTKKYLGDIDD